jgi:hypothetical protein
MSRLGRTWVALVVAACGDTTGQTATEGQSSETSITSVSHPSASSHDTTFGESTVAAGDSDSSTVSDVTSGTGQSSSMDSLTTEYTSEASLSDTSGETTSELCLQCTPDLHGVQTCEGDPVETCQGTNACDVEAKTCINACVAAENSKQSVGCEYYATFMPHWDGPGQRCFAAFVANTWNTPAKLTVTRGGQVLDVAKFARIPEGQGPDISYNQYNAGQGLPPGEVVILFLAGPTGEPMPGSAPCPVSSAVPSGAAVSGTGVGDSFRIESDVPVVAFQMNPYGGGSAAVAGASLLLPTSAWDTNYVIVNALPASVGKPSANIIAHENHTKITLDPVVALTGGNGVPAGQPGVPVQFFLDAGEHAQLTQETELTGSVIESDKPIGLMGGHTGMQAPVGTSFYDHAEQMIPPVRALGSEYVGVMYRPRKTESAIWRVVGAVDGTELTWSGDVGGPSTIDRGERVEFVTGTPFVVKSQDDDHPFFMFTYMSGSMWQANLKGYGDAEYVISVPTDQYMPRYVFFTDPTYPETNLVLVRKRTEDDQFKDVTLDCAGVLGGWKTIGDYEWTRIDLSTGDFQGVGNCSNGRHEISSQGRFGLWIWGWGTPDTTVFTQNVSYGYPAGMNVKLINDVIIKPG